MFKRKPKAVVKVKPVIPQKMALENGAVTLLEQIRRDHEDDIKMCSELIVMKNWAERARDDMLKDATEWAKQFDFWIAKLNSRIERLQGEHDLQPATSQAALTDETKGNGVSDMAVIGFLPPGARP